MAEEPTPAAPAPGFRPQPLWLRVDRNRAKLVWFVVLFVSGSALLLTSALVALPGGLIGWAGTLTQWWLASAFVPAYVLILAVALGLFLAAGSLISAIQLANAEDWVRNRFKGAKAPEGSERPFETVVADIAIAAGLPQPPSVVVLDTPVVNAYALGTSRSRAVIGVTRGLLAAFSPDEQRAVVAALVARIVSGDILFATALAALMGPLKAVRSSGRYVLKGGEGCADGCGASGCGDGCNGCSGLDGFGDGCGCLFDALDDTSSGGGCLAAVGTMVFLVVVAIITYAAVVGAAWIVTLWGRLLHRTAYEKADAEGMLLLKDPRAMLSALGRAIVADTTIADGDISYDGIFYTATSGTPGVERAEERRFRRLAEVLGVDGAAAMAGLRAAGESQPGDVRP
ncbi:MAG: hypothetical protein EG823_07730 [Actinobacteria bacterium]|nr:hypothetical protein [Actinomycetota bacterium]